MQVCIVNVHVVKVVASFRGARSINRVQTNRKKAPCSLRRNWN